MSEMTHAQAQEKVDKLRALAKNAAASKGEAANATAAADALVKKYNLRPGVESTPGTGVRFGDRNFGKFQVKVEHVEHSRGYGKTAANAAREQMGKEVDETYFAAEYFFGRGVGAVDFMNEEIMRTIRDHNARARQTQEYTQRMQAIEELNELYLESGSWQGSEFDEIKAKIAQALRLKESVALDDHILASVLLKAREAKAKWEEINRGQAKREALNELVVQLVKYATRLEAMAKDVGEAQIAYEHLRPRKVQEVILQASMFINACKNLDTCRRRKWVFIERREIEDRLNTLSHSFKFPSTWRHHDGLLYRVMDKFEKPDEFGFEVLLEEIV